MARDTTINVSGTVKRTDGRFVATVAVVQYGLLSSVTGEASTVAMAVKRAIDVGIASVRQQDAEQRRAQRAS